MSQVRFQLFVDTAFIALELRSVRKAVFSAWPKNVCYRSWWCETKPPSNESTTLTLKPRRVDRAPALRGAGLFAVALGGWGLGAVTPKPATSN